MYRFIAILLSCLYFSNSFALSGYIYCAGKVPTFLTEIEPINISAGSYMGIRDSKILVLFSLHNCVLELNK